jgi:hypothetical protein
MSLKKALIPAGLLALPVASFAQVLATGGNDLFDLINILRQVLNVAIPILIAIAVIYFIINVIKFITTDGEIKDAAKGGIMRGIIGIFVIVALWGIIGFLSKSLGIGIGGTIEDQYRINVEL